MAKQQGGNLLKLVAWFTGVIVSLVVGNAMIQSTLMLPVWLGGGTTAGIFLAQAIGWIVVITTIVGAVLALLKR